MNLRDSQTVESEWGEKAEYQKGWEISTFVIVYPANSYGYR